MNRSEVISHVRHSITHKRRVMCAGALTTAVEQGSGYWAVFDKFQWIKDGVECFDDPSIASVIVRDADDSDVLKKKHITAASMERAIDTIRNGTPESLSLHSSYIGRIAQAWSDPENTDIDSEEADIILQVAMFGKVIYG